MRVFTVCFVKLFSGHVFFNNARRLSFNPPPLPRSTFCKKKSIFDIQSIVPLYWGSKASIIGT